MGEQRRVLRRAAVVVCLLLATQAFAQSSATVGSLRGEIRDKSTKEPAAGATVVASSPSLVGEQTVITDETGQYFITSLPPGFYTLTIFFGATFTRGNILVRVGKESVVNVGVSSAGAATEVIEIEGSVPLVDQGSTKTGITLTDELTRNLPTGRTFGDVLGVAAGASVDQWGRHSTARHRRENVFIIDGLDHDRHRGREDCRRTCRTSSSPRPRS